jgi:hypothetical protein
LWILAVAVVLLGRVGLLAREAVGGRLATEDPHHQEYLALAENLADTGQLAARFHWTAGMRVHANRMPALPLILAGWARAEVDPIVAGKLLAWLAGLGVIAVTGWLAWRLAATVVPGRASWAALLAMLAAGLSPFGAYFSLKLLPEIWLALTYASALAVLEPALVPGAGRRWARLAAAGGLMGLGVLFKETGVILLAGLAITAAWRLPAQRRSDAIVLALAAVAVLVPWSARNAAVLGRPVVLSTAGGYNLYLGLSAGADGGLDQRHPAPRRLEGVSNELELDARYRRLAWRWARENPWQALRLAPAKLWRLVRPVPSPENVPAWALWAVGANWLIFYAATGWAMAACGPALRRWVLPPVVLLAGVHLVLPAVSRYRFALEPILAVATAVALASLAGRRPPAACAPDRT